MVSPALARFAAKSCAVARPPWVGLRDPTMEICSDDKTSGSPRTKRATGALPICASCRGYPGSVPRINRAPDAFIHSTSMRHAVVSGEVRCSRVAGGRSISRMTCGSRARSSSPPAAVSSACKCARRSAGALESTLRVTVASICKSLSLARTAWLPRESASIVQFCGGGCGSGAAAGHGGKGRRRRPFPVRSVKDCGRDR